MILMMEDSITIDDQSDQMYVGGMEEVMSNRNELIFSFMAYT